MKLFDKVAIITGSGQGIGKAFAQKFSEEGAKVIIADVNKKSAAIVAENITNKGREAIAISTDVTNELGTQHLIKMVMERYGRIDILVNNAAIFSTIRIKPMEDISVQEWDQLMAVNLRGVFLCCKAVVPNMKKQQYGKIINISSASVFMGKPYYCHYVSSKAGVIGLTRALARELGDFNIQVNCLTPGYTETEVPRETTSPNQLKTIINNQCIKRLGSTDDLLGTMVFLASDENSFMTGQTINVDGGHNFQ